MLRVVATVMACAAVAAAVEEGTCSSDGVDCDAAPRWPPQQFETDGETAVWESAGLAFAAIDADENGKITVSEWHVGLISRLCNRLSEKGCIELFSEQIDIDHNMEITVQEAAAFVSACMAKQTVRLQKHKQPWGEGPALTAALQTDIEQFKLGQAEAKSDATKADATMNVKARHRVQQGGSDACSFEEGVPVDEWREYKADDVENSPPSKALRNVQRNKNRTFSVDGLVTALQEHLAMVEDTIVHASELSETQIDDPEDAKPDDWVTEKQIVDPEAEQPEDWDEEMDGEWEAPTIDNPEFTGEWSAKKIENPEYNEVWTPKNDSIYPLFVAITTTVDDHEVTVEEAIHFTAAFFFDHDAELLAKETLAALPGFVEDWSLQRKQLPQVYPPFVRKAVATLTALESRLPSKLDGILQPTKLLREVLSKFLLFADSNAEVWRQMIKFVADFVSQVQTFPEVHPPFVDSAAELIAAMSATTATGRGGNGDAEAETKSGNPLLELVSYVQAEVSGEKSVRFSVLFRKLARKVALKHTLASFTDVITFGYFSTAVSVDAVEDGAPAAGDAGDAAAALHAASDLMEHMEQLFVGGDEDLAGFAKAANVLAAALEEAGKDAGSPAEWTTSAAEMVRFAGSTYPAHISALGRCIQSGLSANACQGDATADGICAAVELGFAVAKTVGRSTAPAANFLHVLSGAFLYPEDELVGILKGQDGNNVRMLTTVQGWFEGLTNYLSIMSKKKDLGGLVAAGSPSADRIAQVRRAVLNEYQADIDAVMNRKGRKSIRTKAAQNMAMESRLAWLPVLAIARVVDVVRGAHPLFSGVGDDVGEGAGRFLPSMLTFVSQMSDDVQWTIFCGGNAPGEDKAKCAGPSIPIRPETFWQLAEEEVKSWELATDLISAVANGYTAADFPEETFPAATAAIAFAKELITSTVEPFTSSASDEQLALKIGIQAMVTMVAAVKLTTKNAFNNGVLHEFKNLPFKGKWNEDDMKTNNPELKPILKDRFEFAMSVAFAAAVEAAADVNNDGKVDAADTAAISKHLEYSDVSEVLALPFPPFFDGIAWIVNGANNPDSPVGIFLVHSIMDVLNGGSMSTLAELATFSGCAALGLYIDYSFCSLLTELDDGLLGGNATREIEMIGLKKEVFCTARWAREEEPAEGAAAQLN